ncbi:MAG: ferredoxin [Candidatus Sericytochromatia bacterium]|nr:ferredoxin [Candidatus Tanganyikabacteria bacterium]
MPTPHVAKENCTGIGYCWQNCPDVFYEDTDGKANTRPNTTCSDCPSGTGSCDDVQANCCQGAIYFT